MEKKCTYDDYGLVPSKKYFRRKKNDNEDTYFHSEESQPPLH